MLAFGIPGDAVTAVMLGGLLIQGITPGLQLFRDRADLVVPLFVGYFLAYVVALLGLIVGPMLESNFRRALIVSEHGPLIFLQSPISVGRLALAGVLVWYFGYAQAVRRRDA